MPERSAGLLLFRRRHTGVEIFLVHPGGPFWARKDEGAWSIPKGEPGAGEDTLAAAKREFAEETGADVESVLKGEVIALGSFRQSAAKMIEVWAAEGLGTFMGLGNNGGGGGMGGMFGGKKSANAAKWEEALKGKGGFPLRVVTRDGKGKDSFKMEATKIEPGSLPDSLFVPPPGYSKFQMPSFGDMLKG